MAATFSIDLDRDPRAIITKRELDAPRELVFAVWTDPSHLAQRWGTHRVQHPPALSILAWATPGALACTGRWLRL